MDTYINVFKEVALYTGSLALLYSCLKLNIYFILKLVLNMLGLAYGHWFFRLFFQIGLFFFFWYVTDIKDTYLHDFVMNTPYGYGAVITFVIASYMLLHELYILFGLRKGEWKINDDNFRWFGFRFEKIFPTTRSIERGYPYWTDLFAPQNWHEDIFDTMDNYAASESSKPKKPEKIDYISKGYADEMYFQIHGYYPD